MTDAAKTECMKLCIKYGLGYFYVGRGFIPSDRALKALQEAFELGSEGSERQKE